MNIHEFFESIDYQPRGFESDYNTVNGWALEMLEHIPEVGESFNCGLLKVTVEQMDDQRVTSLLVQKQQAAQETED